MVDGDVDMKVADDSGSDSVVVDAELVVMATVDVPELADEEILGVVISGVESSFSESLIEIAGFWMLLSVDTFESTAVLVGCVDLSVDDGSVAFVS